MTTELHNPTSTPKYGNAKAVVRVWWKTGTSQATKKGRSEQG